MSEQTKSGIYKIYCKENDKTYIGQSCDIERRFKEHIKKLKSKKMKHSCAYLKRAWQLYGENAFILEIVEECSVDKLNEREQYYLDLYGKEKLFNSAMCAEAPARGRKVSDETKQKLREANLGEKHPMYGKKVSQEVLKNMSFAHSGDKNHFYGKMLTEDHKRKIQDSLKGEKCYLAKLTWEQVAQIRIDYENDIKTVSQISEEFDIDKSTIYSLIKNITWKDDNYIVSEKILNKLKQGAHIVNEETVKAIREEYKTSTLQLKELAARYNMSVSGFGKIVRNEVWQDADYTKWIADNIVPNKKPTRINYETAQQIRSDFNNEYGHFNKELGYAKIAEKYNLSAITVRKIIKNKLWTNPEKSN